MFFYIKANLLVLLLSVPQLALAGAGVEVLNTIPENPNEPYGCNPPAEEYKKAHNGEEPDYYNLKFKNFAYENLPKKKLITLFNPRGKKIGCIENPDPKAKENKVIIMAQDYPGESEEINDNYYSYTQEDLQKIYANAPKLKEIKMNDERDMYALRNIHFAEEHIEDLMKESGVDQLCDQNFMQRLDFFRKQSLKLSDPSESKSSIKKTDEGKVDFYANTYIQNLIDRSSGEYFESESLFLSDGIAYNPHDFGNHLWGTAISRACIPCPVGRAAGHANTLMNLCSDNKSIKKVREEEGKKGCRLELDSPYDQAAIKNGCHGLYNNRERTKMTCAEEINFSENGKIKHQGSFGYHLAGNGSKVFELKIDGKTEQFVLSSDDKGRQVQQVSDGKLTKTTSFDDVDTKFVNLTDEQILGKALAEKYPWKIDQGSLTLSQEYPREELSFESYIQKKLKVACGAIKRTEVKSASSRCAEAGGVFEKKIESKISYGLTFDFTNREDFIKTKLDMFRRGINRKYTQKTTEALSLKDSFQCTCKGELMEIGVDECVESKKSPKKKDNEVKAQ